MVEKGVGKHSENSKRMNQATDFGVTAQSHEIQSDIDIVIRSESETLIVPPGNNRNSSILKKAEITSRRSKSMWKDPDKRKEISDKMKARWGDEKDRQRRISRIHSPEAEQKRRETYEQRRDEHLQTQRMNERIREKFGDDPYSVLARENGELGKSRAQIAREYGESPEIIRLVAEEAGYTFVPHKTQLKESGGWTPVWQENLRIVRQAAGLGILDKEGVLTPKQREILAKRFTHKGGKPFYPIREVAKNGDRTVSPQAVQNIISRSITLLTDTMTNNVLVQGENLEYVDEVLLSDLARIHETRPMNIKAIQSASKALQVLVDMLNAKKESSK